MLAEKQALALSVELADTDSDRLAEAVMLPDPVMLTDAEGLGD